MIDEDNAIKIALKTGEVIIGSKRSIKSLIANKAKLIIKASNCPAGKAPLRTSPPCECEYCGKYIDYY